MIQILLADDDAVERTALKEILRAEFDVEVVEAADGQAALDLLCDGLRPTLCIVDLKMPKIDGLELIQRVRRDIKLGNIRMMASSASRDRDTILALAKLKISGYLLKPYDPAKTVAQIKQAIADALGAPKAGTFTKNLLVKTLFIIDDDEVSRTALRDILRSCGQWEILEAKDGQDGLNRLYGGLRPDLIFVDLLMPRLDGFSFLQRVRDEPTLRTLKVVVTSADNDRDRVRALAQLQISGYLLKPFDPVKVTQSLKAIPDVVLTPQKPAHTDVTQPPVPLAAAGEPTPTAATPAAPTPAAPDGVASAQPAAGNEKAPA
ncbi:response regulator [Nibricoccus sp. IMCC34717]|uniref:response regulator n=1 Tax=Nibricoccus sp. IMCC34717 TaxID=3034021 RepID=UPI00384BA99D